MPNEIIVKTRLFKACRSSSFLTFFTLEIWYQQNFSDKMSNEIKFVPCCFIKMRQKNPAAEISLELNPGLIMYDNEKK